MKRVFLFLPVLLLFGAVAPAQIVINNSDMPFAGDTIRMSSDLTFPGIDPTLTGANYSWDFSTLTATAQTIDSFISISGTDPVYLLVFGFGKNKSNIAERGTAFSAGGFSLTNVFNFFDNTAARYEQTGFGAYINSVPTATAYSPHDTIYHFPLTYGMVDSSNFGYTFQLPTLFYYRNKSFRHNEVDGWGSLTTPYGTFNVLRVKTTIMAFDSLFLDTLGSGFAINAPAEIDYKWLGKGQGEPLLQINTTTGGAITQIIYRDSIRTSTVGIKPVEELSVGPAAFPNPSTGNQCIAYSLPQAADVKLEVLDMTGNKINVLADQHQQPGKYMYTLNLSDDGFSAGMYMLRLTVNGKGYLQKLLIEK